MANIAHLGELLRVVPEEGRVHVAPRLAALDYLPEAVKVQLSLEAAELVVCGDQRGQQTPTPLTIATTLMTTPTPTTPTTITVYEYTITITPTT